MIIQQLCRPSRGSLLCLGGDACTPYFLTWNILCMSLRPFTEVFYRPGAGDAASAGAAMTSPYSTLCQSKCEEQLSGYENESGRIGSWANRG